MGLVPGDKAHVDHINGNRLDNRRENLRICTQHENNRNIWKPDQNRSGYKGVSFDARRSQWRARIKDQNGKEKWLGYFDTPEVAYGAYCAAAKECHGEFANLGSADVSDLDALVIAAKQRQEEAKRVLMVDTPDGPMSLADLSKKSGLGPQTLRHRIVKANWTLEEALTKPSKRAVKPVRYADEAQRTAEVAT
jgi:lambda repressor-like predicted transcriptional regulator